MWLSRECEAMVRCDAKQGPRAAMQLLLVLGTFDEGPRSSFLSSPSVAKCVARPGVASKRLCTCSTTWVVKGT